MAATTTITAEVSKHSYFIPQSNGYDGSPTQKLPRQGSFKTPGDNQQPKGPVNNHGEVKDKEDRDDEIYDHHYTVMKRIRKKCNQIRGRPFSKSDEDTVNIDQFIEDEGERQALLETGKENKTFLHLLLETGKADAVPLRLHLAKPLLARRPSMLAVKNASGFTPLRHAIAAERQSFLRYFLESFPDKCGPVLNEKSSDGSWCLHDAIVKCLDECAEKMLPYMEKQNLCEKDKTGNTALHLAVDARKWTGWSEEKLNKRVNLIKALVKKCPNEAFTTENQEAKSPYQYWLIESARGGGARGLNINSTVHRLLKEACMRLPTPHETKMAIYGKTPGPQIHFHFDLRELSCRESFPGDFLKNLESHLKLDDVLRDVYLPEVVTKRALYPEQNQIQSPQNHTHGATSSGAEAVFAWLRNKYTVKKIFKVVVKDDQTAPHSDDQIITSLKDFDVEVFDWNKPDICSETILEAAKNVREVVLYSTGNRAVLRSWSAEDGLIQLSKLVDIKIRVVAGSESKQRIEKNLKEFKRRLKELKKRPVYNKRDIDDHIEPRGYSPGAAQQISALAGSGVTGDDKQESDLWLNTMSAFGEFVDNIPEPVLSEAPIIKVALIDDGVDAYDTHNIAGGASFCMSGKRDAGESPYYISSGGHGTMMADLIFRVFPNVQLYVVRLHLDCRTSSSPTAESAAQGIEWAISQNVHIISMSWSIPKKDCNAEAIQDLETQINKAYDENILMFCAATDEGIDVTHDPTYPAFCKDKVFCIGAAKSSGKTDSSVGEQKVDFTAPGKAVLTTVPGRPEGQSQVFGSSIATALSASLCALILFCIGISNHKESGLAHARQRQLMIKILQVLSTSSTGTDRSGDNKTYLRVRELFGSEFQDADWNVTGEKKLNSLVLRLLGPVQYAFENNPTKEASAAQY